MKCPSAQAKIGNMVIGVNLSTAHVQILPKGWVVDQAFLENSEEKSLIARFRFSGECVRGACDKWDQHSCTCSVARRAIGLDISSGDAPVCPISKECRWLKQEGVEICLKCSFITTIRMPP